MNHEPKRQAHWGFTLHQLQYTVLCGVLYVLVTWLTSFMKLTDTSGLDLRPSVVIPMVFGFLFGPWVGLVGGTLGNTISDYIMYGNGISDWQWSLGVGLVGLVPGIYALKPRSYRTIKDQGAAMLVAIVGLVVGMGFASFYAMWICREGSTLSSCFVIPTTFMDALNNSFLPAMRVNLICTLLLLPIVLFNVDRLSLKAEDWHSGLLRRLLITLLVSAALPTLLMGFFLMQRFAHEKSDASIFYQIVGTLVATILFTAANAGILAQSFSRPLIRLTEGARQMRQGKMSRETAETFRDRPGNDEIAELAQTFGTMALEVIAREQNLRKQVEDLKIEIDEAKRQKQVSDIVDTDFFRDLKSKASQLRSRQSTQSTQNQQTQSTEPPKTGETGD
ncbi:ECF transporter S component [Deinococcus roseus]|uniref:HAMP domain-containing protein n=1 Tax=Deinococcus roseus TaxID=392414 RepID=A0ABQ2DAS8_9DEIO|nr:ECF transporter S component [Deinococcus roseus]GGJ52039.1 hypothetical protein GCM10008938_42540 [Deinococcus roseus]